MGLFDFRKPKWRHKDPAVRLASIETIDPRETELLAELGRTDPDRAVRLAAINRLADLATLSRLAEDAGPEDLPVIAARKETLLYDRIAGCRAAEEWREDLEQITSPDLLAELAVHGEQPDVRLAAVNRIDDQFLLAEIVKQNCGKKPAMAALEKIIDESLLADLGENAASKTSRRLAADKIAAMVKQHNPVSDQEIVARKLNALMAEAARLNDSPDMDGAALRLESIKQEWQELDSENNHPAHGDFNRICNDFDAGYKKIVDQRKAEQAAGFQRFQARLEEICATIERLSCSTENDAEAVKKQAAADWAALVNDAGGGMAPDAATAKRFVDACRAFDANREQIDLEKRRVEAIEKQFSGIRELIANHDLKKAAARLAAAEKDLKPAAFKFFSRTFLDKLVSDTSLELNRAETAVRTRNLSRRQKICEKLEDLAGAENPRHLERRLQTLTQAWQQLAKLDDAQGKELEQRFEKIAAELTEKLKTLEHEKDWELWANFTLKEKLTERVVALDLEENLETVVNVIKQSQAEWKEIGPVPHKESQRLWDEFQSACNRNFERAGPYLEEQKTRRVEAMNRRREICVLAAELAESDDWRNTARAIKGFQEEWKTLPHGSRREEQKLYQQFRQACDHFFARRQVHYQRLDEERQQNLAAKEKLCEEAEQLAAAPRIEYPGEFKRLQSAWKKIGPVPRQQSDAVWKRFRAAGDAYFQWLAAEELQNLQRKEELCAMAEKLAAQAAAADDQQEIAARLAELQQQWKETGPVPPDRSEAVWQRFRAPCDQFFAARQEQYVKEEEQRRLNQGRKEEILAGAEDLAGRGKDRETSAQLQELQKEWFETGPAPRGINKELDGRFKALCDAFFEGRRQYFIDLKTEQLENQKKKESLCLRLENILNLSYKTGDREQGKALSLAEELKLAMEDNFMLAGRRDEKKDIDEEVKRIEQEWKTVGPVPPKQIRPLTGRYKKALDAYYSSRRQK
ncbi:MAG: DUF349 domain-containing protein [Desulfobulbaceae bacterium]|nr:DUF349 domain-containing protein [Desulfobulbaceae bacterium]